MYRSILGWSGALVMVTMEHKASAFPQTWLKQTPHALFALMKDHVNKWQTISTVGELGQQFVICNQTDALFQCRWAPSNACYSRGGRVAESDWSWELDRYWLLQGLTDSLQSIKNKTHFNTDDCCPPPPACLYGDQNSVCSNYQPYQICGNPNNAAICCATCK